MSTLFWYKIKKRQTFIYLHSAYILHELVSTNVTSKCGRERVYIIHSDYKCKRLM